MSKLVMLVIAAVLLVSAMAKPQLLVDPYSGYYAAAPAYVASYSAPLTYSYPYAAGAYTYSYPYAYYK